MFVIGRNVEIEVENGKLTIVCQIEGVVPTVTRWKDMPVLARTQGWAPIPRTDLVLDLKLYQCKPK